jgi:DNA-binding response OmpR family regulator
MADAMAPLRIVSVSYERKLMELRSQVLRLAGYSVYETHTLHDALSLAQSDTIDILLICHTIPRPEQRWLISQVHEKRRLLPVLCIGNQAYVSRTDGCVGIENTPAALLDAVKLAAQPPVRFHPEI